MTNDNQPIAQTDQIVQPGEVAEVTMAADVVGRSDVPQESVDAVAQAVRPSDLVKDTLPDVDAGDYRPSLADCEEALKDVVDPELMINIVDLGLVYAVYLDEEKMHCTVDMTLTSPTCPLTDKIEYDARSVLDELGLTSTINWVWMPPWTLDMITDDGREQLRAIGYNL